MTLLLIAKTQLCALHTHYRAAAINQLVHHEGNRANQIVRALSAVHVLTCCILAFRSHRLRSQASIAQSGRDFGYSVSQIDST
jgi:hypothetical protein